MRDEKILFKLEYATRNVEDFSEIVELIDKIEKRNQITIDFSEAENKAKSEED